MTATVDVLEAMACCNRVSILPVLLNTFCIVVLVHVDKLVGYTSMLATYMKGTHGYETATAHQILALQ